MSKRNVKKENRNIDHVMAEVLYQRLGTKWYAFTEVDGDLYMSTVDEEIVVEAPENPNTDSVGEFYHEAAAASFRRRGGRNTPSAA